MPLLDEKQKRIYLAKEAESLGYGGIKEVHRRFYDNNYQGKKELQEGSFEHTRVRKCGGGRKTIVQKYSNIMAEIKVIVENSTLCSPEKILLWTTKNRRNIEKALQDKGYEISHDTISNLLRDMGYSL